MQAGWLAGCLAGLRLATDEATWLAMQLVSQLATAHKSHRAPPHIAHKFISGTPEAAHKHNTYVSVCGPFAEDLRACLRGICERVCG